MAAIDLAASVSARPERVRALLLDRDFLRAFVDEQEPTSCEVSVDEAAQCSRARWTVRLPNDVPGLVKKIVGEALAVDLMIDLLEGRVDVDASAKKEAKMRSTLTLTETGGSTHVAIKGTVDVFAGLLSGQAASLARDQVIEPVFREDLFRLLNEWSARRTA